MDRTKSPIKEIPFEVGEHGPFVELGKFVEYLKENSCENDTSGIRKPNIRRQISRFKDKIRTDEEIEQVPIASVVRYMFQHMDEFNVCKKVCHEIINKAFELNHIPEKVSFSNQKLYDDIIESDLPFLHKAFLKETRLNEKDLQYISKKYKSNCSESDWEKIKVFEWQFQTYSQVKEKTSYETLLVKKFEFLKLCQTTNANARLVGKMITKGIEKVRLRKVAAEALGGIHINTGIHHLPERIEDEISECIKTYFTDALIHTVLCVDCTRQCQHPKGIHVIIEMLNIIEFEYAENMSVLIRSICRRKHYANVPEIFFMVEEELPASTDCIPARFKTRDEIRKGSLNEKIFHVSVKYDTELDPPDDIIGSNLCQHCFGDFKFLTDPLDIHHFNIGREWSLYVPLPIQIHLGQIFSNIYETTSNASIRQKTASLFCLFEAQLKTSNQSYSGFIQDLCTDELLVNYHNISTVFALTSHTGITHSQRTGDRRLRKKSDDELCYYNTYIKQYSLKYKAVNAMEEEEHQVCLRECYLALLMDNLVHLTMKSDPLPGESRTNQLCTLPLTLKGIPKNAEITSDWHQLGCEGSEYCSCMLPSSLKTDDYNRVLVDATPNESTNNRIFLTNMTWGFLDVFGEECLKKLMTLSVQGKDQPIHTDSSQTQEQYQADMSIEEINKTMESITLADVEEDSDATLPLDYNILTNSEHQTGYGSLLDVSIAEKLVENEADEIDTLSETESVKDDLSDEPNMSDDIPLPTRQSLDISDIHSNSDTLSIDDIQLQNLEDDEEKEIEGFINSLMDADAHFIEDSLMDNSKTDEPTPILPLSNPPPLLCRHPPPASGRDDDLMVLKNILDDILQKTDVTLNDKILFAPDFKIAQNLIKLLDMNAKYRVFIPEFPILHLRKSKITNLISAYKSSGLIHILRYMKDDDAEKDWTKLLTIENIETATRNIWRLTVALHLCFVISFINTLTQEESMELLKMIKTTHEQLTKKWDTKYDNFIKTGKDKNANFCLHFELMSHCDEIVAIAVSERIGGKVGYNLLLANVKSSLPFSFLNGASSYAGFCTKLLLSHYSSSPFHRSLKYSLYSTPHNDSSYNFGLDTSREIDHRTAKKCVRPGSTMASLIPKMATVDDQREVHLTTKSLLTGIDDENEADVEDHKAVKSCASKYIFKQLSSSDKEHILRTMKLILRMKALSLDAEKTPKNMYHPSKPELSETVLDKTTYSIGYYLIKRYCCENNLLEFSEEDMPKTDELEGPKILVNRVKALKSVTINRTRCNPKSDKRPEHQKEEEKRQKKVQRLSKVIDCMSSMQNTCQAIVKPDCTKASTNKSLGVKKALLHCLKRCFNPQQEQTTETSVETEGENKISDLLMFNFKNVPSQVSDNAAVSIVEFAGAKFKAFASSGESYLRYVSTGVIKKLLKDLPHLERIIICEEKYSFTPDDLKAATRSKRQKKDHVSIHHLKEENEIISSSKFNKKAATSTGLGKRIISNFLALHLNQLDIKADICIDIDSQALLKTCECSLASECRCSPFATPIRAVFQKEMGYINSAKLDYIKQRKGEAEMAQADWLMDAKENLKEGQCVVNYVTSADIDTVVINLFAVSLFWPRNDNRTFKWPVYVWLQKKNLRFLI